MEILKKAFNERNLVVILFVMVLITFSFAQRESKKLDKIYYGLKMKEASPYVSSEPVKAVKNIQHSEAISPANWFYYRNQCFSISVRYLLCRKVCNSPKKNPVGDYIEVTDLCTGTNMFYTV